MSSALLGKVKVTLHLKGGLCYDQTNFLVSAYVFSDVSSLLLYDSYDVADTYL